MLVNDFLVGADPEFLVLRDDDTVVNMQHAGFAHEGPIGWDHSGWVAEIRPKPARGTYTLLKNIQELLKSPKLQAVPAKRWKAGGYYAKADKSFVLGGHVHIGLSPFNEENDLLEYVPQQLQRVLALDRVTQFLVGLDILPSTEFESRQQTAYGHYGATRVQDNERLIKGNRYHFEYRTMPSWLVSPKTAYLSLTAAKLAVVAPDFCRNELNTTNINFNSFKAWFEGFKSRDTNAKRACEKLLDAGLPSCQVHPDSDVKANWDVLGI